MQSKIIERYFFFGLLVATLLFTFFIFRPFWIVLILGISFSIVLFPIYEWFNNRKLPNWISAFLTVCLFTLVLCGPLLSIGAVVFNQSEDVYHKVVRGNSAKPFIDGVENEVNQFLPKGMVIDINQKATAFVSYVSSNIANIFKSTLSAFFSFILMLLIMFYFLKDGTKWRRAIITLSPLGDRDDERIITKLTFSVNAVIKGYLLISIVQGVLMGLGLWLFGISNPALWGVVAAVASLLPTIGTALVSVPAIIFLFATDSVTSAIGLTVWSVIMVGTIDNFLSPLIVGKKINIPSLLVLFSVLGGISLLGPVGILVGPLTVSLLYSLISIYRNEFKQNTVL